MCQKSERAEIGKEIEIEKERKREREKERKREREKERKREREKERKRKERYQALWSAQSPNRWLPYTSF
jgi:hypothetical protein